jgi:predicted Zn-dependent protease
MKKEMRCSRFVLVITFMLTLACGILSAQFGRIGDTIKKRVDDVGGVKKINEVVKGVSASDMTPEQEYYLGRAVAAQVLSLYPAVDDDVANAYLNHLGQGLALYSTMPETFAGYHFLLLKTPEVNAFAAPGGFIFITQGMLGFISSEVELAAVLAHEIAHVQNRDAVGAISNSRLTETLAGVGSDAAQQYAGGRVPAQLLSAFSDSINDITVTLVTKGYSRKQEYAADDAARNILTQAGYDPRGLYAVLAAMQKRAPSNKAGLGKTHPTPAQRLEALKAKDTRPAVDAQARVNRFNNSLGAYK